MLFVNEIHLGSDQKSKGCSRSQIDLDRIGDIFRDPFALEFIDESHSDEDEVRFGIIGLTAEYGLIYLVFIDIDTETLRLITARKADRWMVREYEEKRRRI